jgi:hypothetical protein
MEDTMAKRRKSRKGHGSCKAVPKRIKGHGIRYQNPCTGKFVSSRGKRKR